MKVVDKLKNFFHGKSDKVGIVQLVTENTNGTYTWNGKIFENDIVRSAINPCARAVGKMCPKHIRSSNNDIKVNPEPYIKFLLQEPNPYMSNQQFQEKMTRTLLINGNAFALIIRDINGYPTAIYPINSVSCEAVYSDTGELYIKFLLNNGRSYTFPYGDIIHLRLDYNDEIFGTPIMNTLSPLMNIVGTTDKGIIDAIKNSSIIRWLLTFTTSMRPEDLRKQAQEFSKNYLSTESDGLGVAAVDSKMKAEQIKTTDYVPNSSQMDKTTQRIYSIFGTNNKIIQSNYTEDEWNSYYESRIEPIGIDFSNEYTNKLFTRKERSFGNSIIFESSNLQYASMSTKLGLVQFLDRGTMTPNEVRALFNYAPIEGGDVPLLRKDTGTLN
mgnify:FL=1